MTKKFKLWLLLLLGICICVPFMLVSMLTRYYAGAMVWSAYLLVYCYLVYHFVYKRKKAKYPMVPPEGRADIYFPRTNIPRPIYEDVQRHPELFGRKKGRHRNTERHNGTRRVKKKN